MLMSSGDHTLSTKVLADTVQNEWVSPCWQSQHVRLDDSLLWGDALCAVVYLAASLSSVC